MTKKDYVLIAEAIRRTAQGYKDMDATTLSVAKHELAIALENDNSRFDRARFLAACEVR